MITRFVFMSVLCAIASMCGAAPGDSTDRERILFRKALGADFEMVVIRGPRLPLSAAGPLVEKELAPVSKGVYSVRLELHAPSRPPLLVWSRVMRISNDDISADLEIFDVLVDGRSIYVVSSEYGDLTVWWVQATPETADYPQLQIASLAGADWSEVALHYAPTPKEISATLSRSSAGKLTLDVVEHVTNALPAAPHHTRFEQRGDKWQFEVVKTSNHK